MAAEEVPKLQGVGRSGSTWTAHLTLKNSAIGDGPVKHSVKALPTQRVAAHARDLLLLVKERLFGLNPKHRHDRMQFPRHLYAHLEGDLQRCRRLHEAASLITRLAERQELAEVAQASAAARLEPQVASRPPSALLGELEGHAEEQQQQQQGQQGRGRQGREAQQQGRRADSQQRPDSQQRQGRQQHGGAAAAAAAAGRSASNVGSVGGSLAANRDGAANATASGTSHAAQQDNFSVKVDHGGRSVAITHWHRKQGARRPIVVKKYTFKVVGEEEKRIAHDLMRLWRQMKRKKPLKRTELNNQPQLYSKETAQIKQCSSPSQLLELLHSLRQAGRLAQLAAAASAAAGGAAAAAAAREVVEARGAALWRRPE